MIWYDQGLESHMFWTYKDDLFAADRPDLPGLIQKILSDKSFSKLEISFTNSIQVPLRLIYGSDSHPQDSEEVIVLSNISKESPEVETALNISLSSHQYNLKLQKFFNSQLERILRFVEEKWRRDRKTRILVTTDENDPKLLEFAVVTVLAILGELRVCI
jgi:hypothetical protein